MASTRNWVGGEEEAHVGEASVLPSVTMVISIDTYGMKGDGKKMGWGQKYDVDGNGIASF